MKRYIKTLLVGGILVAGLFDSPLMPEAAAQCPMCKMSAESNLKDGGSAGKGLNAGILYMLAAPYFLVGTIGFIWYRNRRKEEEEEVA
ncbi:MAG: hypothetical protein KDC34_13845 [Saprospiraceae bacterium]|nr:hypothetical protein [Saprospiraceae bacterium]